jgi:hypothetical protein
MDFPEMFSVHGFHRGEVRLIQVEFAARLARLCGAIEDASG